MLDMFYVVFNTYGFVQVILMHDFAFYKSTWHLLKPRDPVLCVIDAKTRICGGAASPPKEPLRSVTMATHPSVDCTTLPPPCPTTALANDN